MVHEYALLEIVPERIDEFRSHEARAAEILTAAPGCVTVEFQLAVDQPATVLMKVGWDRIEDHLEVFPTTPQAEQLAALIGEFFATPPVVIHFER
ncbi:MAG: antibiotic biosynthesis monooxygenase [Candidatus Leucobacter sulfamidivorax]|nr:antibiotic biosynthesis monooxygenase [Candidatus Leucobacter sulfamidivorax]